MAQVCRAWSDRDERSAVVVRAARSCLRHITFLLRSSCDCTTLFPTLLRSYYAGTALVLRSFSATISPRLFLTCSKCCHALHAHPDSTTLERDGATMAPRLHHALTTLFTISPRSMIVVRAWCNRGAIVLWCKARAPLHGQTDKQTNGQTDLS